MALVQYQVERRPISASGKVYRGLGRGDYITTLTNPENIEQFSAPTDLNPATANVITAKFVPAKVAVPPLSSPGGGTTQPAKSHVQEQIGEPWLVHSTHFSVESALDSAAPLAGAIGSDNVRIVQVLSHTTNFKLQ